MSGAPNTFPSLSFPSSHGLGRGRGPMMNRRQLLQGLGVLGGLSGLSFLPGCYAGEEETDDGVCHLEEVADTKLPAGNWFRGARVAGLPAFADATVCDIRPELDRMAEERVTVVEVDSELSSYLDEGPFVEQLRVCDLVARECHARGMRCVAYYPVLESLTADADKVPHTMYKDHPDWVQVGLDGKPNMFVGGGGRVFWVLPGEESAWLCPTSGFVDYFNERVRRLAGTALDGLWGDVPLLSDIVGVWPCRNPTCDAKFRAETGLEPPTSQDFNDPTFVRWVAWRHRVIWELEQNIVASVKRHRPDFEVIIETVTMDYSAGTVQGLDGAHADDARILRVWEIDVVSDSTAMRGASEDDWYSIAVMFKHARGCSEPRAAWAFCYGLEALDAERVMGVCIATGNSPYETKIPEINTSVGKEYRQRMYSWLEEHPQILFANSANTTAILYSSVARDIVDQARGVGLYTSNNLADKLWWSDQEADSAKKTEYVADYRGFCKLLFQNHVPFDIVTSPHADAATLARYSMIVAPSLAGINDAAIDVLHAWVNAGGQLVLTGKEGGSLDELAVARPSAALLSKFALDPAVAGWTDKAVGAGRVLFSADRAGKAYFNGDMASVAQILSATPKTIETNAPPGVITELRLADTGELVLALGNMDGLGSAGVGNFTPRDASFGCKVKLPPGRSVAKVVFTEPGAADVTPQFAIEGEYLSVSVTMKSVAAVIVTLA